MKKSNIKNMNLGVFVIISTILFVVALYLIGSKKNMFGNNYSLTAIFEHVGGLQPGNNVRFGGVRIGTVKTIDMINDSTICVNMVVEKSALRFLKKDVLATLETDGLIGSVTVSLIPPNNPSHPLNPGDTIRSLKKVSTDNMMSTLASTNELVHLLVQDLLVVTSTLKAGEGTLGMLLNNDQIAQDLQATTQQLKNAAYQMGHTIHGLDGTIGNIDSIINKIDYENSIASRILSDSVSSSKIATIIGNLDTVSGQIDGVVQDMQAFVTALQDGDGPLNYLISDSTFSNDFDVLIENLKQGSELLNEDLKALQYNFLTRRYFRKLEKGKLRRNK